VYRKPGVDGLYQSDGGALLGGFFSCLHTLGVITLQGADQSTAIRREIVPSVHYPFSTA
jgi:hypothetical protein